MMDQLIAGAREGVEARRAELPRADLEARLGQKESDLGSFVARVQGGLLADAG